MEACPVVCDFAPELLSAKLTAGTRTELKWRSKPRRFSSKTPPLAFQVRGCRQQIRSSDEDRAQRAALHRPGQGEDLPRSGPGWSCSNRALAGFVAKLISNFILFFPNWVDSSGVLSAVSLCQRKETNNVAVCVLTRVSRLAEPSQCAAKSSSGTRRTLTR